VHGYGSKTDQATSQGQCECQLTLPCSLARLKVRQGHRRRVETQQRSPSVSLLHAKEVEEAQRLMLGPNARLFYPSPAQTAECGCYCQKRASAMEHNGIGKAVDAVLRLSTFHWAVPTSTAYRRPGRRSTHVGISFRLVFRTVCRAGAEYAGIRSRKAVTWGGVCKWAMHVLAHFRCQ
jgi:hypothetical protein